MNLISLGLSWIVHMGCHNSLRPLYEQEKQETLTIIEEVEDKDWIPDARFRINYSIIEKLGKKALEDKIADGKFESSFLGQKVDIDIQSEINSFVISKNKENNAEFSIGIQGVISIKNPLLSFSNPFTGSISGDLSLELKEQKVIGSIQKINTIEIHTQSLPKMEMKGPIKDWINSSITSLPPYTITAIDLKQFYTRDLRFIAKEHSFDIEILSHFPNTSPIAPNNRKPKGDWELTVSNETISRMIRTKTFQLPPLKNGVYIDAQEISIKDTNLELSLRLWKLEQGGNWWRDYSVMTEINIDEKEIHLTNPNPKQVGQSKNAGLIDPIAVLAEGYILQSITQQIQYTLPIAHQTKISSSEISVEIGAIRGDARSILIYGSLKEEIPKNSAPLEPKRRRREQ